MSNLAYYIVCAVLVAGVLGGIAMMSRVKTAVAGNALSAACTAAAIFVTLYKYHLLTQAGLWVCLALGLAVGIVGAYRVKMIQMPQAVAPAKRLWRRGFGAGCRGFADGGAHWDILSGHSGPCARSWYDHADRQPHCRWKAAKADLTAPGRLEGAFCNCRALNCAYGCNGGASSCAHSAGVVEPRALPML